MKNQHFIKTLLDYDKIKIISFDTEENSQGETVFVAKVELHKTEQHRCPVCGVKCATYGWQKNRSKRWRSLDLGKKKFYVECDVPRVKCEEHGVRTQKIPWAFPDSDYTYAFDMQVAYCAAKLPTNFTARKYRIKWGTVGNCVKRVQENVSLFQRNNYSNLRKIAIDETSWKTGHKYITTVMNLDTGEIVWAFEGFGDEVLALFFQTLTQKQLDGIEYVVADGARWITRQVEAFCPNAKRCVDPFHVVGWATDALDAARKRLSDDAKKNGLPC